MAGGLLCSRYFLNSGAGLPARCQGAALASRRTSSFAAKPCAWLSSPFPRFLCQARRSGRQDLRQAAGQAPATQPRFRGRDSERSSWRLALRTSLFQENGLKIQTFDQQNIKLQRWTWVCLDMNPSSTADLLDDHGKLLNVSVPQFLHLRTSDWVVSTS